MAINSAAEWIVQVSISQIHGYGINAPILWNGLQRK